MRTTRLLHLTGVAALLIAGYLVAPRTQLSAQQSAPVKVKADDIGGVVSSSKGPEAGVWVIAETTDLPTRYIKEVVTDDRGRYLIPDLPKAKYTVWARGYGLVDSPKVQTEPGKLVDLKPTVAPDAKTAAQLYPANYWYALLKVPEKNEFPGTGPSGNGISPNVKTQGQWLHLIKTDSCESCHQLGNQYTRTIPPMFANFDSPAQAWARRVESGQAGSAMKGGLEPTGRGARHRRVWRLDHSHRERRTPRASAAASAGRRAQRRHHAVGLGRPQSLSARRDLNRQAQSQRQCQRPDLRVARREPRLPARARSRAQHHQPGEDSVPRSQHARPAEAVAAVDVLGRRSHLGQPHHGSQSDVRSARAASGTPSRIRASRQSRFLQSGVEPDFGEAHSAGSISGRQLAVYDPATKQTSMIDTCFATHHLLFAEDANNTLWTSSGGGGGVVGWLNTKMWDQTHDEQKSQGWTALVLDTNGNGKRDAYVGVRAEGR